MSGRHWLQVPLFLLLALLLLSQALTDRLGPLQFLWWVPRVVYAAPAVLGFAALLAWGLSRRWPPRQCRALGLCLAVALVLGALTMRNDWGLARTRDPEAFRFAHWNACWVEKAQGDWAVDALLSFNADAILVTDPGAAFAEGGARRLEDAGYRIARAGSFAIVSRVPVTEARPVYNARGRALSRFTLETPLGALRIDAVDLPSETTLPRFRSMQTFVGALEGLRGEPADLIAGDFNITRGSASLGLLVGDARDAFATAGTGWGGTYPRQLPIFPIDLTHVRAPWRAVWADVVDPGFERHCAQRVDLVRDAVPSVGVR
ncbi:MAG: hypothetical protein RL354_1963 [Planctomycetota bacterium]|jgi:endonuclease/exonuclease/phosphatase family metal-dependent hydrolase